MKQKKAIEMGFNWIFAIIVGGILLFLAVYTGFKIIKGLQDTSGAQTASRLVSILDPMETGIASSLATTFEFRKETKIQLECSEYSNKPFGRQRLSYAEENFEKFSEYSVKIPIDTKYVFANKVSQGKKYYMLSLPFHFPFRVSDVIVLTNDKYCIINAPKHVKSKLQGMPTVKFSSTTTNCTKQEITVCFGGGNDCDIKVYDECTMDCEDLYDKGRIVKNNKELYYIDNLLYGGIFSSTDIYECNVKRLAKKTNELAKVYIDKITIFQRAGCNSVQTLPLQTLMSITSNLNSSRDLYDAYTISRNIDQINKGAGRCNLYAKSE